jgi:UDP-N-acetylmuramyl pentapeptide phosphotransferase/UDP-N-acetylglucosamine-1-phosphate transferase
MLLSLVFLFSLIVVCFAIPSVIAISFKKQLFDDPAEIRKVHKTMVPNFGGIAIFSGFLFSSTLLIPAQLIPEANVLMAGGLVLFMVGLQDDVVGVSPAIKFLAQLVSAGITTAVADLRITDLNGMFGIQELPYLASMVLTILFIVGIVNAFNLIDGIDGLAGSLGVVCTLVFAFLFYKAGASGWAYLSLSLTGALVGFLFYNITPAKIFMGDSGSLSLGFIVALLSLKFLQLTTPGEMFLAGIIMRSEAALVVGILIIPVFDTLRVMILRILKNTSPFTADSNHLHHRLLFLGLSHVQAALVLAIINVLFIAMALSLQNLGNTQLIGLIVLSILILNGALSLYVEHHKKLLLSSKSTPLRVQKNEYPDTSLKKNDFEKDVLKHISEN